MDITTISLIISIALNCGMFWFLFKIKHFAIVGAKLMFLGHSLIARFYKDTTVELLTDKNPKENLFGETLNDSKVKITQVYHTLRGSFRPIHIIREGDSVNMNILEGQNSLPGEKAINEAISGALWGGFEKARNMFRNTDELKKKNYLWIVLVVGGLTALITIYFYYFAG